MSRRRYISTDISVDKVVNRLAVEGGDFAALLYTWMIPHAEEDARIVGDPDELLMRVMPWRRDVTEDQAVAALTVMARLGLVVWGRDEEGKMVVEFPPHSFYKYQSNVHQDKRREASTVVVPAETSNGQRESAESSGEQRETAGNAASPSPSPSPTPTPSPTLSPTPPRRGTSANKYTPEFERFWTVYPLKDGKGEAFAKWKARLKEGFDPEALIQAAMNYAAKCRAEGTIPKYIKHGERFLSDKHPFEDYIGPSDFGLTGEEFGIT